MQLFAPFSTLPTGGSLLNARSHYKTEVKKPGTPHTIAQGRWVQPLQQAMSPLIAGKVAHPASKQGLQLAWIYCTAVSIPQQGEYTGSLQKLKVKEHLAKTGIHC